MARPESGECLLDCHEDTGGGGEGEGGPDEGGGRWTPWVRGDL